MKTCGTCKREKPESDFYLNRARKRPTHNCKVCTISNVRSWQSANPKREQEIQLRYRMAHRKEIALRTRKWYSKNKKRSLKTVADWCKRHPEFGSAKRAKQRATQKRAAPSWAIRFFMDEAYGLAALRTKVTGFKWSVDHIVPLQSKLVCGLHAHNNLQVIPASENSRKCNLVWPDMPT